MIDPRSPCVVGVARRTHHPEAGDAPEPLESWAEMAHAAAEDSGGHGLVDAIDDIGLSYCLSWQYDDPTARLAERLGLENRTDGAGNVVVKKPGTAGNESAPGGPMSMA